MVKLYLRSALAVLFLILVNANLLFAQPSCTSTQSSTCIVITGDPDPCPGAALCEPSLDINTGNFTPDPPAGGFPCGTIENNAWFTFVAACANVCFTLDITNCTGQGVQIAIYEGNCGSNTNIVCFGSPYMGVNTFCFGAVPGNTYLVMIDGFAGAVCDVNVTHTCVETGPPPPPVPEIMATPGCTVCRGDLVFLEITNWDPSVNYIWTTNPIIPGIDGEGDQTFDFDTGNFSGQVEICVDAQVPCNDGLCACLTLTIEEPPIITLIPQVYCTDVLDYDVLYNINNHLSGIPPGAIVQIYDSYGDALNLDPPADPVITESGTYMFYWSVTTATGCTVVGDEPFTIIIEEPDIDVDLNYPLPPICVGDCVPLMDIIEVIENTGVPPGSPAITYHNTEVDAMLGDPAITELKADMPGCIDNGDGTTTCTVWVRWTSEAGCYDYEPIDITFDEIPEILVTDPTPICVGLPPFFFDLGLVQVDVIAGGDANSMTFEYYGDEYECQIGFPQLYDLYIQQADPGVHTYYVRAVSPNGCASECEPINVTFIQAPTAVLSGGDTVCVGEEIDLIFEFTGGYPPYNVEYTDGNGMTFTIATNDLVHIETVLMDVAGTFTFTITDFSDGSGGYYCTGAWDGEAIVVVNPLPEASIRQDTTICPGDCAELIIDLNTQSAVDLVYFDSESGVEITLTGIFDGHVLTVCPTDDATYTLLEVVDVEGCEGLADGEVDVMVGDPLLVTNVMAPCSGNQYTVSFTISGGDPGSYMVTGDPGTLAGNMFTGDPMNTNTTYTYIVTDATNCDTVIVTDLVDACCETYSGDMDINVIDLCEGDCINIDSLHMNEFLDMNDVYYFILHDSPTNTLGNVLATSSSGDFCYMAGVTLLDQTYYVSPAAGNDNGGEPDPADPCFHVNTGVPVIWHSSPSATLAADGAICDGESYDLTVSFTGTGPYQFSYLADGTPVDTITTPDNPYTFSVMPGTTTNYTLGLLNDNFCPGSVSGSAMVEVNDSVFAGNLLYTCDGTNTQYTVTFTITGGDINTYMVTPAGTITGNTYTSGNIPSGDMVTFEVSDANGCNVFEIDALRVCDCTTEAGAMSPDTINLCEMDALTAVQVGANMTDANDIVRYILHNSPVPAIGSQVLAWNDQPTFAWSTSIVCGDYYYVSAVVGDPDSADPNIVDLTDPCFSIVAGQPVVWHCIPEVSISGAFTGCEGEDADFFIDFSNDATGPYNFEIAINGVGQGQQTTMDDPHNVIIPNNLVDATVTILTFSDANCPGLINGQATIDVSGTPSHSNLDIQCDTLGGTPAMVSTFEITGGSGNYVLVKGFGAITGNMYMSNPITGTFLDTVIVTDDNMCGFDTVIIARNCDCLTFSGVMLNEPLTACADEALNSAWDSQTAFEEADDILLLALHTGPSPGLGTVIQWKPKGIATVWTFDPNTMNLGQTYYVSAVAANDSLGFPMLSDTCLSVSNGQALTWYGYPVSLINSIDTVLTCDVSMITLDGSSSTGDNSISYFWSKDGVDIGGGDTRDITAAGLYELVVVDDVSGCSDTTVINITIDIADPVAIIVNPDKLTCANLSVTLDGSGSSYGTEFDVTWTASNGGVIPAGTTSLTPSIVTAGTYEVMIRNTNNGCTASYSVTVDEDKEDPIAVASALNQFDCNTDVVTLDASGTSLGSNFVYQWTSLDGFPIIGDTTLNPTVSRAGVYVLTVTDVTNGCTASDQVVVDENAAIPQLDLEIFPITCFGECDGYVIVDEITGGTPPFSYAIDNGPFTPFNGFYNLCSGDFLIQVRDANGCLDTLRIGMAEPDELIVTLGDDEIINLGESFLLDFEVNMPIDTFFWSDTIPNTPEGNVEVSPTSTTTYKITVIDSKGCEDSDVITVIVAKDFNVFVPTVFSPNGDGINDQLMIFANNDAVEIIEEFRIFDRWGAVQYEAFDFAPNDPNIGWDGSFDGKPKNPAVFVYYANVLFKDGEKITVEGDFTLLR